MIDEKRPLPWIKEDLNLHIDRTRVEAIRTELQFRKFITIFIVLAAIYASVALARDWFIGLSEWRWLIAFGIAGIAAGWITFLYLQPASIIGSSVVVDPKIAEYIQSCLEDFAIKNSLAPSATKFNSKDERDALFSAVQKKIESEALESYIKQLKHAIDRSLRNETEEIQFKLIVMRMGREVADQARRGNLNLVLGILTTIIGLSVMGYSVFNAPASQTPNEVLMYFLPRVSLAIVVEVFAYFFLSLYKQSLSEIKYFQNEITNIESRQLAMQFAARKESSELSTKVVDELIQTERNFLINKGQTTVEIEREKATRSTTAEIVAAIKELVNREK